MFHFSKWQYCIGFKTKVLLHIVPPLFLSATMRVWCIFLSDKMSEYYKNRSNHEECYRNRCLVSVFVLYLVGVVQTKYWISRKIIKNMKAIILQFLFEYTVQFTAICWESNSSWKSIYHLRTIETFTRHILVFLSKKKKGFRIFTNFNRINKSYGLCSG